MDQLLASTESAEPIQALPFDDPIQFPSFLGKVIRTIGAFLLNPIEAIHRVALVSEGPSSFSFLLAIEWPLYAWAELIRYLSGQVTWPWVHRLAPKVIHPETLLGLGISILFAPIGIYIGFWIMVYVFHGLLWVWRGLEFGNGTAATERALGFTLGITTLVGFGITLLKTLSTLHVPMNLDHWIWGGVCIWITGYALAKVHRTDLFRGFGALMTPVVLVAATVFLLSHGSGR